MSCSSPLRIYESDLKESPYKNHSDFVKNNLSRSLNTFEYANVPCGQSIHQVQQLSNLYD